MLHGEQLNVKCQMGAEQHMALTECLQPIIEKDRVVSLREQFSSETQDRVPTFYFHSTLINGITKIYSI